MNYDRVYKAVERIPKGKVASYKQIALLSGLKNPRNVGHVLHFNPDPHQTPCHRVVHTDRSLPDGYAFGGKDVQKKKLMEEGVKFNNEKIRREFFWKP